MSGLEAKGAEELQVGVAEVGACGAEILQLLGGYLYIAELCTYMSVGFSKSQKSETYCRSVPGSNDRLLC